MKCKKSIASVLSVALLGNVMFGVIGNNGCILNYGCDKVSAMDTAPYSLEVLLNDYEFEIPKDGAITTDMLKEHKIFVNEVIGTIKDGKVECTYEGKEHSLDECTVVFPETYEEGNNDIIISYCPKDMDKAYTVSATVTVDVSFEGVPRTTEPPTTTTAATTPLTPGMTTSPDNKEPSVTTVPDEPVKHTVQKTQGNVTFDLTDSVAQPGEVTYLDINIGENTGFCAVLLSLDFDDTVFEIKSISTTSDFTGKEYSLKYNLSTKKMIFMNSCRGNLETPDTNVIRVGLAVKKDAPEGDYTVDLKKSEYNDDLAGILPDKTIGYIGMTTLPGTVTVSKTLAPKTNVSSMSLGRVYAEIKGQDTVNKTGDTTGDGKINALDTIKMIKYFTGTEASINNGDVDENGKVNISDLIKLKNYITLG